MDVAISEGGVTFTAYFADREPIEREAHRR